VTGSSDSVRVGSALIDAQKCSQMRQVVEVGKALLAAAPNETSCMTVQISCQTRWRSTVGQLSRMARWDRLIRVVE
jgi:hypothetical protein